MGLFSSICKSVGRFVGGCAETVGRTIGWERLENAGRNLKERCAREVEDTSRKTAEQDSYDETFASIAETNRMNKILSEFSLKLADYADDLEENAIKESSLYFNELVNILEENKDKKILKINTSKIKRNKIKIEKQIKGSFKKYLSKRVSLDDYECLSILKLDAGIQKKNAMSNFGNRVLKEASYNLCSDIEESLLEQQEYIEECLDGKMEELMIIQNEMIDKFEKLEQAYEEGKDKIDEEKNNILSKIAICELALSSIV